MVQYPVIITSSGCWCCSGYCYPGDWDKSGSQHPLWPDWVATVSKHSPGATPGRMFSTWEEWGLRLWSLNVLCGSSDRKGQWSDLDSWQLQRHSICSRQLVINQGIILRNTVCSSLSSKEWTFFHCLPLFFSIFPVPRHSPKYGYWFCKCQLLLFLLPVGKK